MGGVYTFGMTWDDLNGTELAFSLAKKMIPHNGLLNCSLKNPCQPPPSCEMVGPRFTLGRPRLKSLWAYLVLWAIRNINQEVKNQYDALQGSAIDSTLETFNVDDYFPKPDKKFPLLNSLTGLGTVFAAVSGFLGPLAGVAGAVGAIAPAVGTAFERSFQMNVDRSNPLVAQKTFAPKVRKIYDLFTDSLENITADLFAGREIAGRRLLPEMMRDGAWVDPNPLTDLADAQQQIFFEIFSRSIDQLWKAPTSNKMWVLYVDLQEEANSTRKCDDDRSGPQDLKYCDNGGVYYAYNFIEKGNHLGYLGYPWGADKLLAKLEIDPKVSTTLS